MIPERGIFLSLGLHDSIWALIIFHTVFQTGFATLSLRNFVAALPNELFEAARLEGAGELTIIWRIIGPAVPTDRQIVVAQDS